jgi:alpha-glucosidase
MNNSIKIIYIYRESVEEAGKLGDVLFWMRAGGIKSKHHQVMSWAGDQTVDWTKSDGLPSSIVAALSLAVSGKNIDNSIIDFKVRVSTKNESKVST